MDYSPSPSRVKPQYAFLDNTIEVGRSEKPFKSSPLKNVSLAANRDDTDINDMQKKFYNKYSDLKPQHFNSLKPSKTASNDTTDRLFKDLGTKVPVDDDVKISSNMVEKIIRENERLKHDKELVQTFAKGLKEKLLKYKQLNDTLKTELAQAQEEKDALEERSNIWKTNYEKMQAKYKDLELLFEKVENGITNAASTSKATSKGPELNFNTDDTQSIFSPTSNESQKPTISETIPVTTLADEGMKGADSRIKLLENTISNNEQELGTLKREIEFLKTLIIQTGAKEDHGVSTHTTPSTPSIPAPIHVVQQPSVPTPVAEEGHSTVLKEDEWVMRETFELNQLQAEVMELHKKISIREDNMRKKSELKRQLLELSVQLERADEPPKKAKSIPSSPETSKVQSTATQHHDGEHNSHEGKQCKTFDSSCVRCAKTKDGQHSPSPKATPTRGSSSMHPTVTEEPKHFHINGVKWY